MSFECRCKDSDEKIVANAKSELLLKAISKTTPRKSQQNCNIGIKTLSMNRIFYNDQTFFFLFDRL